MRYRKLMSLLAGLAVTTCYAAEVTIPHVQNQNHGVQLHQLPGFFRFSFDNLTMPDNTQSMGLLGINYFADITHLIYGGIGGYGAVTGTQGGLFVLGADAGLHHEFIPHWWGDAGLFVGGGGGKSSLVGGGLMLRPYVGIAYQWAWARFGLHYSYIDFVSGKIRSQQIGVDLDIPTDFYYLPPGNKLGCSLLDDFHLPGGKYLDFQRNDFGILLQNYRQKSGTLNTDGEVQDGTIGLVGAEFDHYVTERGFWWLKTAGAFSGIPNGYMDVLGGVGYHWPLGPYGIALVPQFGIGAGGGGLVDTGGGFLVNPQLGIELPIMRSVSARVSSGYLWSPKGQFKVVPITGELLYHLDISTTGANLINNTRNRYEIQGWRIQLLNQTYFHPQRSTYSTKAPINLIGVQIDQLFTPYFFLVYQAAAAYSGFHAGGYATGMIGAGLQSPEFMYQRLQVFSELLVGAGGGGGLALSGGSIIEPIVGLHYALTPIIGLQASVSELKALNDNLNTPVFNLGVTLRFDTLYREREVVPGM